MVGQYVSHVVQRVGNDAPNRRLNPCRQPTGITQHRKGEQRAFGNVLLIRIFGRWLAADIRIFLFDAPTRGIDIGAKAEVIRVSDRVLVMREGRISATLRHGKITEANIAAARHARQRGVGTLLNAAPARIFAPDLVPLVDILAVTAVEAEMMGADPVCCLHSAADAARRLADRFEAVIVTAGSKGLAAVTSEDEAFTLPAEKVEALSSHGAGDAFIGALCAALVRGLPLRDACRAASQAAAIHVSTPALTSA
jgi:hypothetical protein